MVRREKREKRWSLGRFLLRLSSLLVLMPTLAIVVMRWVPPPSSAFMLRDEVLAWWEAKEDFVLHQHWVDGSDMAPSAGLAVIAAEDQLFTSHCGFNLRAMAQAWERNQKGGRIRGGSTLSQQTAKNLFLYPTRSLLRKGLEAVLTVLLELLWPKSRILEVYLNIAQFGDGIYGVEAASREFFGKPARLMTPAEAALLAAVLPNPLRLRADRPSAYVFKRQAWILKQMRQLGGTIDLR
ncbi:MAG: monofunctional biosynthetic peptidoglycan transglycosylase [Methylococcaceae bacterium]|nr:monofunctional biosynthetic peptidoglycan transglycosylase [Methylococcaceae bacterium]